MADGRRVFLDADPRWWSSDGWQQQEIVELVNIESHFRFRRISDSVFEVRPRHDETALDQPHLSRLFPSNSGLIEESLGRAEASQRASQTGREP